MFRQFPKFSSKTIKEVSELTNSTLVLLHVIFRHGNRTPVSSPSYPTDPWKTMDHGPYGPGQLTNKGKQTMYNLGCFIREYYDDFLGEYSPGVVEARTTCVDRTQCSLQLVLAGLYPPRGDLVWNSSLLWQPIPYVSSINESDKLLQAFAIDRQYKKAYSEYQKCIGIKQRYSELFSYVEHHSKKKIKNLDDIWLLYFKLLMQKESGLKLPFWTRKVFPSPFEELAALNYVYTCATPELRRYVLKPLTDKLIADTAQKILEDRKVLIHIYSGHETNLAHALIALNSFTPPHIPTYGSCVILEVHVVNSDVYIKGLYKRGSDAYAELLPLWDQNPMNFKDFVELLLQNYE